MQQGSARSSPSSCGSQDWHLDPREGGLEAESWRSQSYQVSGPTWVGPLRIRGMLYFLSVQDVEFLPGAISPSATTGHRSQSLGSPE